MDVARAELRARGKSLEGRKEGRGVEEEEERTDAAARRKTKRGVAGQGEALRETGDYVRFGVRGTLAARTPAALPGVRRTAVVSREDQVFKSKGVNDVAHSSKSYTCGSIVCGVDTAGIARRHVAGSPPPRRRRSVGLLAGCRRWVGQTAGASGGREGEGDCVFRWVPLFVCAGCRHWVGQNSLILFLRDNPCFQQPALGMCGIGPRERDTATDTRRSPACAQKSALGSATVPSFADQTRSPCFLPPPRQASTRGKGSSHPEPESWLSVTAMSIAHVEQPLALVQLVSSPHLPLSHPPHPQTPPPP